MKRTFLLSILLASSFSYLRSQTAVVIDQYKTYQTMAGLGGHDPRDQTNLMMDDLGVTVMRIWLDPAFKPTQTGAYNFDAACSPSKTVLLGLKAKGMVTFIATPWSMPAWMKVNGNVNGGNSATNILKTDMYSTYADYLVEYAKQFKAQIGIDLTGISVQNEPRFDEPYPSCIFTPAQMCSIIKLAGPKLVAAGLTTKFYAAEDMGGYATCMPWFQAILGDTIARKYVGAWAVHGYSDGVNPASGDASGWTSMYNYIKPYGIPMWMTETSGYFNNWTDAMQLGKDIHVALKYGKISAWFWWRLVVGASETGWIDEALVMGTVPNKTYYSSKNFFKYIRPGSQQIESSCSDNDVWVTAFTHGANKNITIILLNVNASSSKTLKIQGDKLPTTVAMYTSSSADNFASKGTLNTSSFTIPANSISTLVFTGSNKQPTISDIDTQAFVMKKPGVAANYSVNLSGISDGGGEGQTIAITETHTNTAWFSAFAVSYTSPAATGKVNFSPVDNQTGNTTVTLSVSDGSTAENGFLSVQKKSFVIKLIPFVNHAPTVGSITTWKAQKGNVNKLIPLTGITDGDDGSQKLTITAETSDNTVVTNVYIKNYTAGGSTANINFMPTGLGTATITLTIRDDAGRWVGGSDTKVMKINVEVLEYYDLENTSDETIQVYPNPASEMISISSPGMTSGNAEILDLSGKVLMSAKLSGDVSRIDVKTLLPGLYLVRINDGEKTLIRKIVVE